MNSAAPTHSMRPRARLMLTIGRDLISSETVALTELVKNSFDADAGYVLVRVTGKVDDGRIAAGTGRIEVLDNGTGMSADRIADTWLVPATDYRKEHKKSKTGRRTLGEKGVGRFAAAKLADGLVLSSKMARRDEVTVKLNWNDFDDPDKYLDEIDIDWSVGDADIFSANGRAAELWAEAWDSYLSGPKGSEAPARPSPTTGTYLRMDGLSSDWDRVTVSVVRRSLARLISPFADKLAEPFTIILDVPPEFGGGGIVESPEELDRPHYRLGASVTAAGVVTGEMVLTKRAGTKSTTLKRTVNLKLVDRDGDKHTAKNPVECGPFTINLRVWDRDAASLAPLGTTVKSVRETLDQAAGVSVYRDGFRVLPYGEPGDDWLRLDLRRVQNPTMALSNNQIVGHLSIGRDRNPDLVDQTNREGLVGGPAFEDLRDAVRQVLVALETARYGVRPRPGPRRKGGLLDRVDLSELRDAIAMRLPQDKAVMNMVIDLQGQIDRKTEEVGEALTRYHRLATLGGIVDRIVHEISQPILKVRQEARLGLKSVSKASKLDGGCRELIDELIGHLEMVRDQGTAAADVVARIEPFGGRRRGRPPTIELEAAIRNAVDLMHAEIKEIGAIVELPEGNTKVTVDGVELQEVILNLLNNSVHWLRQVNKSDRRIVISVKRNGDGSLSIIHDDSGPGVDEGARDHIFAPYFTTRDGGAGLGLAIAGEIVEDFYGGTLELLEPSSLGGARFRATLRRRVGE